MKNLKRLLGLMAISGFAFGFAGNVKAEETTVDNASACASVESSKAYVKYSNGVYGCYSGIMDAMKSTKFTEGETIVLLDNVSIAGLKVDKSFTLDLNGKTLSVKASNEIEVTAGNNLTVKNGTLSAASSASLDDIFKVSIENSKKTALTIDKDVVIDGTDTSESGKIIVMNGSAGEAVVNLNGTWKNIKNEIIDCSSASENLTINLNANVEGAKTLITVDAGKTALNITGGSYTTDSGAVMKISSGKVNITDGTFTAKKGYAIRVDDSSSKGKDIELKISGGKFTSQTTNSIYFTNAAEGKYAISGGTFTSGKDADGKQIPAISIGDKNFIDNQKGIITGGTFAGAVVDKVKAGDKEFYDSATATKILVGEAKTTTDDKGNVTVGGGTTTEQTPTEPQKPGTTTEDDKPSKNPQTYDGILSYVTLAISSLGALGFATKKVLF